jgi:hypothetical protein
MVPMNTLDSHSIELIQDQTRLRSELRTAAQKKAVVVRGDWKKKIVFENIMNRLRFDDYIGFER